MRHTIAGRICNDCGRPLETGETCNCHQPVRGATRDGLRARCPCFQHRSSYRGRYYLVCGGIKTVYPGCEHRNDHYRRYCCNLYGLCEKYIEGEQSEPRPEDAAKRHRKAEAHDRAEGAGMGRDDEGRT